MVRVPSHREPTHPGEMLIEEFLNPMGLTQRELSTAWPLISPAVTNMPLAERAITILRGSRSPDRAPRWNR